MKFETGLVITFDNHDGKDKFKTEILRWLDANTDILTGGGERLTSLMTATNLYMKSDAWRIDAESAKLFYGTRSRYENHEYIHCYAYDIITAKEFIEIYVSSTDYGDDSNLEIEDII